MASTPRQGGRASYGLQPICTVLAEQGRSLAFVARRLGKTYPSVFYIAHGKTVPPHDVRQALVDLLGVPVEELFTREALAAEPRPSVRPWVEP